MIEIYVLHKTAETFTRYDNIPNAVSFLERSGKYVKSYKIFAQKGKKTLVIDEITSAPDLIKQLTELQNASV